MRHHLILLLAAIGMLLASSGCDSGNERNAVELPDFPGWHEAPKLVVHSEKGGGRSEIGLTSGTEGDGTPFYRWGGAKSARIAHPDAKYLMVYCDYVGQTDYWQGSPAHPVTADLYVVTLVRDSEEVVRRIPVFYCGETIAVYDETYKGVHVKFTLERPQSSARPSSIMARNSVPDD